MNHRRLRTILFIAACVCVALAIRTKFERFTIPQNGMVPGFPAGSTHWATKHSYRSIDEVALGDVVLFRREIDGALYNFVWRVIAKPGDDVTIERDNVTINGESIRRDLVETDGPMQIYVEHHGGREYHVAYDSSASSEDMVGTSLTVPQGHLFVLGDNRYHARDSRYDGPVPFEAIFGKL